MTAPEISQLVLSKFNLRIENHMSQYVANEMRGGKNAGIPVIGGDARTGIPRRQVINFHGASSTLKP